MLHLKSRAKCQKTVNFIFIHLWTHASLKVCVIHFSFSEMSLYLMLNYTYLSFLKIIQDLLFINTHAGKYAAFKTEYHMTTSPHRHLLYQRTVSYPFDVYPSVSYMYTQKIVCIFLWMCAVSWRRWKAALKGLPCFVFDILWIKW